MSQFDASNADCEYVQCAVCEKIITGCKWFARIKHGESAALSARKRSKPNHAPTCGGSKPFSSCGTHNRSRR
jgi:hypothetical protein